MQSGNKSSDRSPGRGLSFFPQSDMERADKSSDQNPLNAKVAENTDGKPLVRERSEDGLCLTLVVLQSISFVLTSPTNRKLVCGMIKKSSIVFDARFHHGRSLSMYADVSTNDMIWKATGAKS